jgi:Bifunctional DNA primase/polymerase, N-terminal
MVRHDSLSSPVAEAAEWYAVHRRWAVVPGTYRVGSGCSCGRIGCPSPGAHPASAAWKREATDRVEVIRARWSARPEASIVLPTGRLFDVLDVPEFAGREALTRLDIMGYRVGPVAQTAEGRLQFWVSSGARVLYGLGDSGSWPYDMLDLGCLSCGDYVVAPPTGGASWVFAPAATSWHLPNAYEIAGTIADACRQVGCRAR